MDLFAPHGAITSTLWPASRKKNFFQNKINYYFYVQGPSNIQSIGKYTLLFVLPVKKSIISFLKKIFFTVQWTFRTVNTCEVFEDSKYISNSSKKVMPLKEFQNFGYKFLSAASNI